MLQGMCVYGGVKIKIDAMVTFSGVFHFYIKLRIIFFSMVAGKRFISIRAPSEIGKSLITLRNLRADGGGGVVSTLSIG